jgi:Spy/CpxP family protein refolding chaperone
MRKRTLVGMALVLAFTLVSAASFAAEGMCPMMEKGGHGKSGDQGDKAATKAAMILKHKEELGITTKQEDQIDALLLKAKKEKIKQDAEIEILGLDIQAKMKEDTINLRELNPLIDKKYDLKKARAKASLAAYAELKNILTDKQKETLKELYKTKMSEMKGKMEKMGGSMMGQHGMGMMGQHRDRR